MSDDREWYYRRDDREWGPVSLAEIDEMIATRFLAGDVLVRESTDTQWRRFDLLAPTAGVLPATVPAPGGVLNYQRVSIDDLIYAPLMLRISAALIDWVIAVFVAGLLSLFVWPYISENAHALLMLAIVGLYFAFGESSISGSTVGKSWMRLRVVTIDGRPISFFNAAIRFLCKWLSVLPLAAGVLMARFNRRSQMFHDWCADTVVIEATRRR